MSKSKELLENKISELIQRVASAGSWKKPFKQAIAAGVPINHHSGRYYKGANIFFLWMEANEKGYQTNNWLTYKQCMQLKARITKGEKATPVFFFKPIELQEENDEGVLEQRTVPMLRVYHVFNLDQTTLKPQVQEERDYVDPIESCEAFFEHSTVCEVREGVRPYYAPNQDYISMPSIDNFVDAQSYYATFAHECIHATGHPNRLDRDMSHTQDAYAYEELIAELGASFISAHLRIDADDIQDNAAAYLKHWLHSLKDDPKYLWKAMSEASKAYEYILTSQNTQLAA